MKTLGIALTALGLSACGGTANVGILAPDAAPPASSSDSGPSDGGSSARTDAGATGEDASDNGNGDAGLPADAIDPIVVGRAWTFNVTEVGYYPLCPSGTQDAKVLDATTRDGRSAFEVNSFCTGVGSLYYAPDGDVVYWDYQGTWILVLDAPVADGHKWDNGLTTYAWKDVGTVQVPAGTFDRCFQVQDQNGPSYSVLCRGIGPVRYVYRDANGNGYDAVLAAKNF